jgi:two-component system cell cycle sensor histidine kinase/response regulator CckA
MKKDKNPSADAAGLSRRAETRLRAAATKGGPTRTEADTQRLVHELQVHQIELEMQNEELRQSRAEVEAGLERYTDLYDFAPVGYLTLGRDGAIRQVNLTGARLLGVERTRLVGRRFGVLVAEPDQTGFKAFLEKVFASQAKETCEVTLMKEEKGPLNVQITATVSQDGQECRVMMADITERKRAEEALRESERFLRSTLDGLSANIALLDEQGKILLVNKAWREFAENNGIISVSAVSEGSNYLQICDSAYGESAEEAGPFAEGIRAVLSGVNESYALEYPCHSPDKKRWFVGRITPFPGDGPRRVVVAHEDITECKVAGLRLTESEHRYRTLADSGQALIWTAGPDKKCNYFNLPWLVFTGRTMAQEMGDGWAEGVHPEDLTRCFEEYSNAFDCRKLFSIIYRLRRYDGEYRWIRDDGMPRYDAQGNFLGYIGHCLDITEHKLAEEALRALSSRQEVILAAVPEIIVEVDCNKVYTWANRAGIEFFGEHVIGKEAAFYFEGEQGTYGTVQPLFNGDEQVFYVESWQRRRDGQKRLLAWWCRVLKDAQGTMTGALSTARDITERRREEKALRESEARYRTLIENIPQAVLLKDRKLRYISINKAYALAFGLRQEEVIGKSDYDFHPKHFADKFRQEDRLVMETGESREFEEESVHSGQKRFYYKVKVPVRDSMGKIIGVLSTLSDITERQQAEEELRDSEERHRRIIEASSDAILLRSSGGIVIFANPAAFKLFRANHPTDLIGKQYLDLVHPDDRALSAKRVKKTIEENWITSPREHRILALDGQVVSVESIGGLVKHRGETQMFGVFRDITERERAEQEREKLEAQFRQAQKMEAVGRLSGGVAHDFNNMLGVIIGFTDLASMKLPANDPVQMYLDEVKSAAQRSADITRQLLAFARKQIIAPKVLDLNNTIESMLKMLRRLIGEDIDLLWKPANDLWPVKMDPAQIDQILANLMVNARDAIAGVGKITIETGNVEFDAHYCKTHVGSVPGPYVLLAVSDDGCGMDQETLAKLFEPFFTTKEVGKGTGLGLATIYGIVKQNNGFIDVYSEPGQGTTFKIYLPRQESQEAATEQPRQPAEVPTGTETVLLVEDENSLLKFTRILLEELGYAVLATGSPREAIQLAKEYTNEIHLLMTDVVMPEMSGRDLCIQLEASRPGLKCLFMSGYTANVIAHQGVLDEGVHFLQKPFSRGALATKMRDALS